MYDERIKYGLLGSWITSAWRARTDLETPKSLKLPTEVKTTPCDDLFIAEYKLNKNVKEHA